MNEIMDKTYELIDALDESELIRDIGIYRDKILEDNKLCELIKRGNTEDDEYIYLDIKRKLYKNEKYKNYMDKYNELMYLVMDINSRFNEILGKGSCYR